MDARTVRDEHRRRGRRSRVVLTPRRWCQVRRLTKLACDGGKKARSPGRSRITRNTIAQGMPDDPAEPVEPSPWFFLARGPWVRPSPGIPCALSLCEGEIYANNSGAIAPREGEFMLYQVVIASDLSAEAHRAKAEAKQCRLFPRRQSGLLRRGACHRAALCADPLAPRNDGRKRGDAVCLTATARACPSRSARRPRCAGARRHIDRP